jgi:hypothetical protein
MVVQDRGLSQELAELLLVSAILLVESFHAFLKLRLGLVLEADETVLRFWTGLGLGAGGLGGGATG